MHLITSIKFILSEFLKTTVQQNVNELTENQNKVHNT